MPRLLAIRPRNAFTLEEKLPVLEEKLRLKLDYAPTLGVKEVPDPYYGGAAGFEEVLDLLEIACAKLLESLQ